ncbi:MAG: hypothetical protein JO370_18065 [Paucibacter sp.]|nr:hypothetical protein [Roseateles sp.]
MAERQILRACPISISTTKKEVGLLAQQHSSPQQRHHICDHAEQSRNQIESVNTKSAHLNGICLFDGLFQVVNPSLECFPSGGIKRTTSFSENPFEFPDEFLQIERHIDLLNRANAQPPESKAGKGVADAPEAHHRLRNRLSRPKDSWPRAIDPAVSALRLIRRNRIAQPCPLAKESRMLAASSARRNALAAANQALLAGEIFDLKNV